MNIIKKIYILVLVWILFLQSSFFSVVFAQNDSDNQCNACQSASREFQSYVNFQVEMLQILQKAKRKEVETSKVRTIWLFWLKILTIPEVAVKAWSKMFKSETEDLVKWYKSLKMWGIMLWAMAIDISGKIWWISILFNSKPFVRERSTLKDIETSIHDAMWDLWMEWIWDDPLSDNIQEDVLKLKQKYLKNTWNENWLFEKFILNWSVKYKNITNMMLRLNSSIKMFLAVNHDTINTDIYKRWNFTLQFNKDVMDNMIGNYKCVQIGTCSSLMDDFKENTKVWSQIKEWFEESKDIISDANDRFKKAYLSFKSSVKDTLDGKENTELWLTNDQLQTLRTVYGIDTTKLSKEQWIWLEKLLNGWVTKWLISDVNAWPLDYFSKQKREKRKIARAAKKEQKQYEKHMTELALKNSLSLSGLLQIQKDCEEKWQYFDLKDFKCKIVNTSRREIELKESLLSTLNNVYDQKSADKELFLIYSNMWVTRYFVEIWAKIHAIIDDSIGTKDSQGLVKYLWETCELQCTNKWTSNCFSK